MRTFYVGFAGLNISATNASVNACCGIPCPGAFDKCGKAHDTHACLQHNERRWSDVEWDCRCTDFGSHAVTGVSSAPGERLISADAVHRADVRLTGVAGNCGPFFLAHDRAANLARAKLAPL